MDGNPEHIIATLQAVRRCIRVMCTYICHSIPANEPSSFLR